MGKIGKFSKNNRGFTLVELIVTIAVSAILLSASVAGIIAWVHHADFVRNESYAETIYYAAQAELTRYRGNGQLAELDALVRSAGEDKADIMGKVPVYDVTDDHRAGLAGEGKADEYNERYKDRLYYLKKGEGPVGDDNPLGGLLSDYIYDGSIMDGAVCVEFDPSDGTVYSVTYSDRNTVFTYGEAVEEKEFSLLDRTKGVREKSRVGYYSTELSDAAPTAVGKTRVAEVQLINEDQLYLKWSLPGQFSGIRKFLSYTIEIYDKKADGQPAHTFVLKGRDLKETDASLNIRDAAGKIDPGYIVELAGDDGVSCKFIAYSLGSEMYLVLDSIDYGADPEQIAKKQGIESGFDTDALRNSASVLQLFSEPKDIYVRVQAQGKPYKTSAWKQSNASNTLFAAMKEGGLFEADKNIYEIKNARHLYNIRYLEKENEMTAPQTKETCYRQTGDIVWSVDENKLFHSISVNTGMVTGMEIASLQEDDKCVLSGETEQRPYFPAIPKLGENSVLEVESGRSHELKELVLYRSGGAAEAAEDTLSENKLGLIEINEGTVRGLTITGVNVQGVKNVGAVCGINADTGKILDTVVSGRVSGKENIGGLVGLDMASSGQEYETEPTEEELKKDSAYINLVNYAEVAGSVGKVGGIVGCLNEKGQTYRCENYGAVKGTEIDTVYIGGISGYNKGLVQNCTSAPADTPPGRGDDGELERAALKGIFVGGIVGCNNGGTIRDSGTAKETKNMFGTGGDAYIIGYRYVGGIVGYNNSSVDGGNEGTLINGQDRTNKAKVIGHDYVGGIVGANGLLKDSNIIEEITPQNKSKYVTCEIDKKYSSKMIVEDWVNEGMVEAVGAANGDGTYDGDGYYAGGIAGYNAGDLKNCTTRINTSSGGASDLIDQVRLYGKNASYVGGVAGYNVGHIYREDGTTSVNSVVSGKKYVGGIAGYNGSAQSAASGSIENSGRIENYELSGGYISAESYAGGYVGLNTTERLLSGTDGSPYMLTANPNEVTADHIVGGVMGALILAPENNGVVRVNCATDNFFGSVKANYAFAGGYVGYTQVLKKGENAEERAEALREKLAAAVKGTTVWQEQLQELTASVLDERLTAADGGAELQFKYEGVSGESQFASIEAPIFAGGAIGGNSWNTKLLLENIQNKIQVKATDSVTYDFISKASNEKDGTEKQDTFSFAGGIIGLVTPKAEVVLCSNSGAGGVQGTGTYGGGIAEVNLGTIRDCDAATAGNKNYYGGIAGLNTNEGKIISCTLKGQISGDSYLGGIAACNESIIENCTVEEKSEGESAVIGTGKYVGGIAAINRVKGKTETESYVNEITGCTVDANIGVLSRGEIVGGVLGSYQGGSLKNTEVKGGKSIYGLDCVGGIAGEISSGLEGTKENMVVNGAAVNAEREAGGIGGLVPDNVTIKWCENRGMVRSMSGFAGGIVPQVTMGSTVEYCRNTGSIEAVTSIAGGIAAENNGAVENCTVQNDSAEIVIRGTDSVGGITGENKGTVIACEMVGNVSVSDINANGAGRAIGGIAGKNKGLIREASIKKDGTNAWPKIATLSQGSYLGGVAGTNMPDGTGRADTGKIQDGTIDAGVVLEKGQQGTSGGIAGANAGTIVSMTFSGEVAGRAGFQYGTGGIAGRNEMGNATGVILSCRLRGGTVSAESGDTGFGGHEDNAKGAYVGGICGINPKGGSIESCLLEGRSEVSGDYGYVGGIVAYNLGTVENILGDKAGGTPRVHGSGKCVMGGIAAYNGETGVLENCATGEWSIENENTQRGETYPTGGIIGSNKSVYDQKDLENNATVSGGWMTGGVIGQQYTKLRDGFTIENCINKGNVTANHRSAGGIISDWRGQSGRVRECINEGQISITDSNSTNAAGGIIGTGWYDAPVSITIERCGNEGKIMHSTSGSGGRAGGIFGCYNSRSDYLTLEVTDCYNAAEIQNNGAAAAGIFAGDEGGGKVNLTIVRCVNYGKGTDSGKSFAGIAVVSAQNLSGNRKITQCLNAGECYKGQDPIARNISTDRSNYYFYNPDVPANSVQTRGAMLIAEHKGNVFQEISKGMHGAVNIDYETSFDRDNNRLILPDGRYLQFTDVAGTYDYGNSDRQGQIKNLKDNFSATLNGNDFQLLLFGITSGKIQPPDSITLKETGDLYTVTYKVNTDTLFCTDGYELQFFAGKDGNWKTDPIKTVLITDVTKSVYKIDAADLFRGVSRADYTEIRVRMRARKNSSYAEIDGDAAENGRDYSAWSEYSNTLSTKPKLPTPQLRFEVSDEGGEDELCGYWVLENAEDYKDYKEAYRITIRNTDGSVTGTIEEGTIKSALCRYDLRNAGSSSASNVNITACAEPVSSAGSYSPSDNFERQPNLYPKKSTLKAVNVDKGEFTGTKKGELGYRFSMKQDSGNYRYVNITCMAELWFKGEKAGEGTVLLPNDYGEAYCTIDLSSMLDEDIIREMIESVSTGSSRDVKVCFYPWEIHEVKYYVTDDAGKEIVSRTVPKAAAASEGEANNKTAFNSSYQTVYVNGLTDYKMHPAPKPGETLNPDITDGAISYTLYWDMEEKNGPLSEMYPGAEYSVTVTGKNGDTEVLLYQGSGDKENGKVRNKVTLQENNWKYQQLILTVERLGKEKADTDATHYIGASTTKEYGIPIRLNSVQGLNAKLRDRHSLVIDVAWLPSAETGVGGYEITVKGKNAIGKEISITVPVDGKDSGAVQIDLDEKNENGEEIYKELKGVSILGFSIVAVPKNGDANYMESRESDTFSVTIPARLNMPNKNPELMIGEEPVSADKAVPPEAFTEFVLKLEDTTASSEDAAYEVEYFITDKDADTNGPLIDWDQKEGVRPEADAENGIYISAADKMEGNLNAAIYRLKEQKDFDAEQAGRKIWYRVRAISTSKVSSVWTEWVEKELPKVLLEPVEIAENETVDEEYIYKVELDGTTEEGGSHKLSVRQPKAGFAPIEFAKGYEILIQEAKRMEWVRDPDTGQTEEKEVIPEERIYTLEETEPDADGTKPLRPFKLTGKNGDVLDDGMKDAADVDILETKISGDMTTYIYTLYTITHSYKVDATGAIYRIPVDAKLCYSTKDDAVQEIWLELPEGVALADDNTEISHRQFIATSSVDVAVITPDTERYVVDYLTRWQRVANDDGEYTDIEISKVEVKTAAGSRIAVAGYYEDMLYLDEMSDSQLDLLGIDRELLEILPEEEEQLDKSDLSGNDTASGNDAEEKEPEKPEKPEKPDDGKEDVSGNDSSSDKTEESEGNAEKEPGDSAEKEPENNTEKEPGDDTQKEPEDSTEKESEEEQEKDKGETAERKTK